MKRKIIGLALAFMLLAVPLSAPAEAARGFDTPEACAEAVFDALNTMNTEEIENCFAFREMAERFDFRAFSLRIGAVTLPVSLLPANSEYNIEFNESRLKNNLYMRICFTSLVISNPDCSELIGKTTVVKDEEAFDSLLSIVADPETTNGFAELRLLDVIDLGDVPSVGERFALPKMQENLQKNMAIYQVEEYRELAILAQWDRGTETLGTDQIVIPLRFVCIDGKWLADPNASAGANLMMIDAYLMIAAYE